MRTNKRWKRPNKQPSIYSLYFSGIYSLQSVCKNVYGCFFFRWFCVILFIFSGRTVHMWALNASTTNKFLCRVWYLLPYLILLHVQPIFCFVSRCCCCYVFFSTLHLASTEQIKYLLALSLLSMYLYTYKNINVPNVHIYEREKRDICTCLHGHFIALSCLISSYYSQHFSFYSCSFSVFSSLLWRYYVCCCRCCCCFFSFVGFCWLVHVVRCCCYQRVQNNGNRWKQIQKRKTSK